jgi:hypothetical protein
MQTCDNAKELRDIVSSPDSQGDTMLHLAVIQGNSKLSERLFALGSIYPDKHPMALVDTSILNKDGETAAELQTFLKTSKEKK